jgi:radical SAM protein with 4Fe4S-binding SPASM domain
MTDPNGAATPGSCYARAVSDWRSFTTKAHRLPTLVIELTERCNNSCRHCYINRPAGDLRARAGEMGTDFVKDLIRQAADLDCLDLRFTGGEPLLREDFSELYRFSRRRGLRVLLSTNARLITPELARMFRDMPPGQPLTLTTYGMSPETYDKASGVRGSFEEFRGGVRRLEENRVDFGLRMAVLPENRADIPAYENWIGALFQGRQKPDYIMNFYQRARRDSRRKSRRIRKIRHKPEAVVDRASRSADYSDALHEFCRRFTGLMSDRLFECGFGQSVCVDAYGFAQGCLLLRHPDCVYDLRSGTLADALSGFFPPFADRRATDPLFLRRCARCCLRGLCGQCPAQSWMENGSLDAPVEYQCRIAHGHARKLGLLSRGENGWEIADWPSRLRRKGETILLTNAERAANIIQKEAPCERNGRNRS